MAVVFTVIAAGAAIIGFALAYFLSRRFAPVVALPCDRCGNRTDRRPLPGQVQSLLYCDDCDQWLTKRLFPDPHAAGYDRVAHAEFLRAYGEIQRRARSRPTL